MDSDRSHILVVDDDSRLRCLLRQFLDKNGFLVVTAASAEEARRKLQSFVFDMLIVDVMMPGESGLSLTESLRKETTVPILMLSAMGETEDRIAGFERGADDYLTKPFEPRELILRIRTVLRRQPVETKSEPRYLSFGQCWFDIRRAELTRDGAMVRLTETEARVLKALALRAGTSVAREILTAESHVDGSERAIDVLIMRLRRKMESDPKNPRYLQTIRGKGYTLMPD